MNKTVLGMAVATALASPVALAADATIYGRAHVSVDMLDDGADYSEMNVSSNSSRLGFKASKETESGITGLMQIEGEITYNQGSSNISNRDTFVGLRGGFGMIRVGQFDTPFKRARGPANLFGDQLGDMRNLTRAGDGRFDERMPNTLHYQTPSLNGLQFNLAYSFHEGTEAEDDVDDQAVSVSATWGGGPVSLAVAYESYEEDAARGERDAVRFALAYDVIDPLKLVAFYQTVDHDDDTFDSDTLGLGAQFSLTSATALKAMAMQRNADPDDSDSSMLALGVEHRLDSALRVYANYAMVDNDDNAMLTPWNQGRSVGAAGAAGETASGISLGLRYDF